MATVRIQVRRGTASQWSTTNPVLAAGEMGVETDTNLFKFGNGTSTWTALSYANNSDVAIGEISQDAINNALSLGAGLTKSYNDGTNTIEITVDSNVIALKSYVDARETAIQNTADATYIPQDDRGAANGVASLNAQGKVPTSEIDLTVVASREYAEYLQTQDLAALTIHTDKSLNVHGIADTSVLATDADVADSLNAAKNYTDTKHGIAENLITSLGTSSAAYADTKKSEAIAAAEDYADTVGTTAQSFATGAVSTHNATTTSVHGIADTSLLATKSYADTAADNAESAAITAASDALGVHAADTTSVHGIADTSALATKSYADNAVSTHEADTTNVHGIADTSKIVLTTDTGTVTSAMIANATIVDTDINASAAIAQSKISGLTSDLAAKAPLAGPTFTGTVVLPSTTSIGNVSATEIGYVDGVTSAIQTQLDAKAPLASPTFTGTTTAADVTITGNLTVSGTTTTVDSQNLAVTDSLIYLAKNQYSADALDIGIYGAYGAAGNNGANHPHTGLVRDASDGKWKLISGGAEPTSSEVDFTTATKDTLVIGALDAVSATIGNVSNTELQYLDGVTSAIQTQINAKAPAASPTFTGAVTVSASGVVFTDGTQTKAGVPSITAIGSTRSSNETLTTGEQDKFVPISGAVQITLPSSGYSTGQSIDFWQSSGTGASFAGTGVVGTPGLKLRTTYSVATAMKIDGGWLVFGDLSA